MTQVKAGAGDRRRMASHLETAMPDLPLPQMIYLFGILIAFALFMITLGATALLSNIKKR